MKGFVPLRRGITEHLPSMTDAQVKLYVLLLSHARNTGDRKGTVTMSAADIAFATGWSRAKAHRVLSELSPRYVKIDPSQNQHAPTVITICRFTGETADETADETARPENETANAKYETAPAVIDSFQRGSEPLIGRIGKERERETPYSPPVQENWSPWPDAEYAREAILDAYPNKVGQTAARTYWQAWLVEAVDAPKQARAMFAAAKLIAERCPPEKVQYLGGARKFLAETWADPWEQILDSWTREKQGKASGLIAELEQMRREG